MLRRGGIQELEQNLTSYLAAKLRLKANKMRVAVKCSRLCKHRKGRLITSPYNSLAMMLVWHTSSFDTGVRFGASTHFSCFRNSQKVRVDTCAGLLQECVAYQLAGHQALSMQPRTLFGYRIAAKAR